MVWSVSNTLHVCWLLIFNRFVLLQGYPQRNYFVIDGPLSILPSSLHLPFFPCQLNDHCGIPASLADQTRPRAWRKVSPLNSTAETLILWETQAPFLSLLNSQLTPWSFFFFSYTEKREQDREKKVVFFLIWRMSASPWSGAQQRVPSRAAECINI